MSERSANLVRRTERLSIRQLHAGDCDALHAVYSDADAMRWVGDGRPLERADCEHWIEVTLGNYQRCGYGMYAIELAESAQVIGFCGLVHPDDQPDAEAKYALRREYWGRGIATEALAGLLGYGFETLQLAQIIATTAPQNRASHRVLEKAGFVEIEPRRNPDGSHDRVFRADRPG